MLTLTSPKSAGEGAGTAVQQEGSPGVEMPCRGIALCWSRGMLGTIQTASASALAWVVCILQILLPTLLVQREQLGCRMLTQGPEDDFLSLVSAVLVVLLQHARKESRVRAELAWDVQVGS